MLVRWRSASSRYFRGGSKNILQPSSANLMVVFTRFYKLFSVDRCGGDIFLFLLDRFIVLIIAYLICFRYMSCSRNWSAPGVHNDRGRTLRTFIAVVSCEFANYSSSLVCWQNNILWLILTEYVAYSAKGYSFLEKFNVVIRKRM